MLLLVFSLIFLFIFALGAFIGAMKGRKYMWQMSVSRIILSLASAAVAVLLSCGISFLFANVLKKPISSVALISSLSGLNIGISIVNVLAVLFGIIISALLFIPIFWGVRGLMKLLLRLLTGAIVKMTGKNRAVRVSDEAEDTERELVVLVERNKYEEFKLKKASWVGALCGGICGALTVFIMAVPVVGLLTAANEIVAPAMEHVELGKKPAAKLVELLDASANNVTSKSVSVAGGKLMFNSLTYCKVENNATSNTVRQDTATVAEVAAIAAKHGVLKTALSNSQGALAKEQFTYEVLLTLFENPRLHRAVDMVSDEVIDGFLRKVRVPKQKAPLYAEFLAEVKNVSGTDVNTLAAWYGEVFDDYGLRISEEKKYALAQAKLAGIDVLTWISNNVVSSELMFCSITERIAIEDVTAGEPTVVDTKKEAALLAHAISMVCNLPSDVNSPSFDVKEMMAQLGPIFDTYSASQTVGPLKTEYMLMGILQSRLVHDKVGMTVLGASESAEAIYENAHSIGYKSMMNSLAKAVEVVEAASSDKKDTSAAVKAMLADLTPQSSKVLRTMSTPSVMRRYGVPERSAAPVASMVGDTFKNLSDAKENGMSDEEYDKEAAAVSNMMDILMVSDKRSNAPTFGEGSVTGVSAQEYVNNIMNSKVMSATVVDKVYVDGAQTPSLDPLNSKRVLGDQEKTEFAAAINTSWNASAKDDEAQKKLISIAAMLNIEITLNAESVFEIVEPVEQI